MTVLGVLIFGWGCTIVSQSRDALHWPYTQGQIISSSLSIDHLPKYIDLSYDPLRIYGVDVEFSYTIGDVQYSSKRLSFSKTYTMSPKDALKVMNSYRHLKKVKVYYNPSNPQEAVLEPGNIAGVYVPLMIGGLLTLLGLFFMFGHSVEFGGGINNYLSLAQTYQNRGDWDNALALYNQAIRVYSFNALGYIRRGEFHYEQRNYDQAINDFKRAINIDPNNALVYVIVGNAYLAKKQYNDAWVYMHKAMDRGFKVDPLVLQDLKSKLA